MVAYRLRFTAPEAHVATYNLLKLFKPFPQNIPHNPKVLGSNPSPATNKKKDLAILVKSFFF